jgi:hypothetical protein
MHQHCRNERRRINYSSNSEDIPFSSGGTEPIDCNRAIFSALSASLATWSFACARHAWPADALARHRTLRTAVALLLAAAARRMVKPVSNPLMGY